jgi:hypothetical protein
VTVQKPFFDRLFPSSGDLGFATFCAAITAPQQQRRHGVYVEVSLICKRMDATEDSQEAETA